MKFFKERLNIFLLLLIIKNLFPFKDKFIKELPENYISLKMECLLNLLAYICYIN